MASLKDLADKVKSFIAGNPFTTSQLDRQIPSMVGRAGNTAQQALLSVPAHIQQKVSHPAFLKIQDLPQIPQNFQKIPAVGPLLNADRNVVNWGIDTYGNMPYRSFQGAVGLGENVRHGAQGNPDSTPQIFANLARAAELPASIYTLKGVSAPAKAGYHSTTQIASKAPNLLSTLNKGGLTAARHMAPFSAINAIGGTGDAPNVAEQLKQAGPQFIKNELAAYVFGAGTSGIGRGLGNLVNKGATVYKRIFPNATDAEARAVFSKFVRDEVGRFAKQNKGLTRNALPAKEPVFYGDLRESYGLPRNGEYSVGQGGFVQIPGPGKIRGFPKTVSTTLGTPPSVATGAIANPQNYYSPLSDKEVVGRVSKLIAKDEQAALQLARTGRDTDANASAMLLIDKYLKAGKYEQANHLITEVSPRFTEQGQQIHILSLYGRLTPTGAVKYTQRLLNEVNAKRPANKQLVLTPEATEKIVGMAKEIQKHKEGTREYNVAVAKMLREVTSQVPPSVAQKIATLQTMAQLLNPKTAIRNVVGNAAFAGAENTSTALGAIIDRPVSMFTGRRSVTMPSFGAQTKAFGTGLKYGIEDAKLGIDTSGRNTKFDLPKQTFTKGPLGFAEKALNMELRATDRAFAEAAKAESLVNQMKAAGVTKPTGQMVATAEHDALYRTFQDNSMIASTLTGLKKLANKPTGGEFGAGDIFLKYPKTPGNLVARGLDYSPAGFLKTVYELARPQVGVDIQRNAVMNLSRAITGTGIIATGVILAKLGLVTGRSPNDYDISGTQKASNDSPFRINVSGLKRYFTSGFNSEAAQLKQSDLLVSYDWLQPNAIGLSMGADVVLSGGKTTSVSDKLNQALSSLGAAEESITGQPVIQNAARFAKVAGNPNLGGFTRAVANLATDTPATFVPSLLNQTAQFFDTNDKGEVRSRSTYDPNQLKQSVNKVVSRVPGFRQNLEPNIDVFGRESTYVEVGGKNPLTRAFNIAINPAFLNRYMTSPEANLVLDIFNRTGETTQAPRVADKKIQINGENVALSSEQYRNYQQFIGTGTQRVFNELAQNPEFMALSDEEKAKEMASILSDINTIAKIELFGNAPKNVSKSALGLLNRGVFSDFNSPAPPAESYVPQASTDTKVYSYVKDGAMKTVDLSQPIPLPNLTGQTEVDKKLKSQYASAITRRTTEIAVLVDDGQMTPQEAESQIASLKELKSTYAKTTPKVNSKRSTRTRKPKISNKKISIKLARVPKIKTIKIARSSVKALKLPKIKLAKAKKLKATEIAMLKY